MTFVIIRVSKTIDCSDYFGGIVFIVCFLSFSVSVYCLVDGSFGLTFSQRRHVLDFGLIRDFHGAPLSPGSPVGASRRLCAFSTACSAGATIAAENGATDRLPMAMFDWSTSSQATPPLQTGSGWRERQRSSYKVGSPGEKSPTGVKNNNISAS